MSNQQNPLITALEIERKSLEHKEKFILNYARKKLLDLPAGLEIQVKRDWDGEVRFEALRIIQDKDYFCLYFYQQTDIKVIKRMCAFLDKAIRQNSYPDGSFTELDFEDKE
jgi:hypothetical protein